MPVSEGTSPARWQSARPLIVAAASFAVLGVVVAGLAQLGPRPASARRLPSFVGVELHSLVSLADGRVFVGGHDGVAVTRDAGRTWTQVPSLTSADAMGWGVSDNGVFVTGHPGLRRSTDNGKTFHALDGLPDPDTHAFGAGPNSLYAAGPALGVVASGDGGLTWEQRSRNEGATFLGRILVDPADANHLTAADARTGPSVSVDGGRSWRSLQLAPVVWVSSPDGGPTVYASSGMGGAWRSSDAGKYWEALELPRGATLVEAAAIGDGRKLYAAGVDGEVARLWVSVDGGATWNEPAAKPSNS